MEATHTQARAHKTTSYTLRHLAQQPNANNNNNADAQTTKKSIPHQQQTKLQSPVTFDIRALADAAPLRPTPSARANRAPAAQSPITDDIRALVRMHGASPIQRSLDKVLGSDAAHSDHSDANERKSVAAPSLSANLAEQTLYEVDAHGDDGDDCEIASLNLRGASERSSGRPSDPVASQLSGSATPSLDEEELKLFADAPTHLRRVAAHAELLAAARSVTSGLEDLARQAEAARAKVAAQADLAELVARQASDDLSPNSSTREEVSSIDASAPSAGDALSPASVQSAAPTPPCEEEAQHYEMVISGGGYRRRATSAIYAGVTVACLGLLALAWSSPVSSSLQGAAGTGVNIYELHSVFSQIGMARVQMLGAACANRGQRASPVVPALPHVEGTVPSPPPSLALLRVSSRAEPNSLHPPATDDSKRAPPRRRFSKGLSAVSRFLRRNLPPVAAAAALFLLQGTTDLPPFLLLAARLGLLVVAA